MKLILACFHICDSIRSIPLGAASVAAQIKKEIPFGLDISIVNCYMDEPVEQQISDIISMQPDILGLSIYVWNKEISLRTAADIQSRLKKCTIIVGGPEPSADPETYQQHAAVDYVIQGEAEISASNLIREIFNDPAGETENPSKRFPASIPDLEFLPSPYLDGTIPLSDREGVLWELSRGCPFKCAFCFESRGHGSIRRFSEARITAELKLFRETGIRELFVLDPTFNYHRELAGKNLRLFRNIAPELHYSFEIRAEYVDEELAEEFSLLNCTLQIGLQSIHPQVLRNINRTMDVRQFSDNIYLLHNAGAVYGFDLIYGLPGDSLAGFLESLDYAFQHVPNHIDIFPLAVLPGTVIAERAQEFNLEYSEADGWEITSTPDFQPADLVTAASIAEKVDTFYNKGKAVSWFDIVLNSIGVSPSDFFLEAAASTKSIRENQNPLSIQIDIIRDACERFDCREITELATDLARYFWIINNLVADDETSPNDLAVEDIILVNPTIALDSFHYDPLEIVSLCEQGVLLLQDIADLIQPAQTNLVCYFYEGELASYYASPEETAFLQAVLTRDVDFTRRYLTDGENLLTIETMVEAGIVL